MADLFGAVALLNHFSEASWNRTDRMPAPSRRGAGGGVDEAALEALQRSARTPTNDTVSLSTVDGQGSGLSGDKTVAGYLFFLAAMDPSVVDGSRTFADKVAELEESLAEPGKSDASQAGEDAVEVQIAARNGAQTGNPVSVVYGRAEAHVEVDMAAEFALSDGRTITVAAHAEASVSIEFMRQESGPAQQKTDPLALDLDGDGRVSLSSADRGVVFDIDGDGRKEQTAFVSGSDGFLALDRNGNGSIDSGSELFGDQNGAANGYLELAKFDDNQDGLIDEQDGVYRDLLVLHRGADGNFVTQTLAETGVKAIGVTFQETFAPAENGNAVAQTGSYQRADGSWAVSQDVLLTNYQV